MTRTISSIKPTPKIGRIFEWLLLFIALLAAVWIVAQDSQLPNAHLMLLILLYVLTVNFSIPMKFGYIGLTPIAIISSILTIDSLTIPLEAKLQTLFLSAFIGIALAEIMRPFWKPLVQTTTSKELPLNQRLSMATIFLTTLGIAVLSTSLPIFNEQTLIEAIQPSNTNLQTFAPVAITTVYFILYIIGHLFIWRIGGNPSREFFSEGANYLLGTAIFSVPLTLFITSSGVISIPAFVFLCIGIAAFAITTWTSWQRRFLMVQRLDQFALLNAGGASIRESLDLPTVIDQIHQLMESMVPADRFFIVMQNDNGVWEQPLITSANSPNVTVSLTPNQPPDGLTQWVVANNQVLDLDQTNMYHAERRNLILPTPKPTVWLGVPLNSADKTFGAMVLQKFDDIEPFTRWEHEVLLSIAGQASAAIQNARLYSETLRLYNLTDEALARRLEQLQALLFSIKDGVLMVDTSGHIILINPAAATLLGTHASQLRGTMLDPHLAAQPLGYEPLQLSSQLTRLAAGDGPAGTYTFVQTQADRRRHFERIEVPVSSDENRIMGWLLVIRDVTEERERAEWRQDLTRMIVHDLRNPITTLTSTVDLIEGRLPKENRPNVNDLIASARHGCANMLEMVDSLMDINRAEVGKFIVDPEAMRLPALTQRVMNYALPLAAQRSVNLSFEYSPDLPAVWADEEIVRRVLVNLLDNALKFTPSGGAVTGKMQVHPAHNDKFEDGIQVTIIDNGPGIAPDQKERIFDRFVTFNPGGGQVRGTGLGLTFCKLAIEAHHGQIWVEDAQNQGSAFIFTLPGIPIFD